jgi:hypothetical protein
VTQDRGVNTDELEDEFEDIILSLDKGIQVCLAEGHAIRGSGQFSSCELDPSEKKMYHVIDKR